MKIYYYLLLNINFLCFIIDILLLKSPFRELYKFRKFIFLNNGYDYTTIDFNFLQKLIEKKSCLK